MLKFLNEKIAIIKKEARASGSLFIMVLGRKIITLILLSISDLISLYLLILFIPLLVLLFLILRIYKKNITHKKNIFFIGLEHVIDKTCDRGVWFEKKGFRCIYFSYEWSGSKCSNNYHPQIVKYTSFVFLDVVIFLYYLIKYNPAYTEVYFEGNGFTIFFASLFSKINNTLVIAIERGSYCFNLLNGTLTFIKKKLIDSIFYLSDYAYYREYYMEDILSKIIDKKKLYFDHNKVQIKEEPDYNKKIKNNILFLNGFTKDRRIDLIIKALPEVRKKIPGITFDLVGARSEQEFSYAQQMVNENKVTDIVKIHTWTTSTSQYFNQASLYILLSEYTFCNISLLEAMERGLPVILLNARDVEKIIDVGISGLITNPSETELAEHIIKLMNDEELLVKMGKAARDKIKKDFNAEKRLLPIYNLIKKKLNLYY